MFGLLKNVYMSCMFLTQACGDCVSKWAYPGPGKKGNVYDISFSIQILVKTQNVLDRISFYYVAKFIVIILKACLKGVPIQVILQLVIGVHM